MQVFNDYSKVSDFKNLALSIGTFDGMHLGHQAVIKQLIAMATQKDLLPAVLTFDPHPTILSGKEQLLLQPLKQRLAKLEALGCQIAIVQDLRSNFSQLSPQLFVADVLAKIGTSYVQVGRDFSFGANRSGKFSDLETLCKTKGIIAEELSTIAKDGFNISSSAIRQLLLAGEIIKANQLLGYNYTLFGPVVHGANRGHTFGFPTANIATNQLLPLSGVYGGLLHLNGQSHIAAIHIGPPTTFGAKVPTIEAFLPNYQGPNFYDSDIQLELTSFIRPTLRFSSQEELINQMNSDVAKILVSH